MESPRHLTANGVDFAVVESGPADGPVALVLHGFPDTPGSLARLGAALAGAGWRAVAAWMRGYHPTGPAPDGVYQGAALALDALALADALCPDRPVAVVGHDWGGVAACGAAALRPERVAAAVSLALPHPAVIASRLAGDFDQLRRSWYMWFFQLPGIPEIVVAADGLAFVRRLWREWSPGLDQSAPDVAAHLDAVCATLGHDGVLEAALAYYRQTLDLTRQADALRSEQAAILGRLTVPALFVAGAEDGCFDPGAIAESPAMCDGPARAEVLDRCGHFLQMERPDEVEGLVLEFLGEVTAG